MPCDYRILQSPTKGQVLLVLLETSQRSLKDKEEERSSSELNKRKGCAKIYFDTTLILEKAACYLLLLQGLALNSEYFNLNKTILWKRTYSYRTTSGETSLKLLSIY